MANDRSAGAKNPNKDSSPKFCIFVPKSVNLRFLAHTIIFVVITLHPGIGKNYSILGYVIIARAQ